MKLAHVLATGALLAACPLAEAGDGCGAESAHIEKTSWSARPSGIVDTAVAAGSFKTLAAALQAAGLAQALEADGPFTVFAPTDDAFARLPEGTVETLLEPSNRTLLTAVLTYHVVPGALYASDVVKRTSAATLNGQQVAITLDDGVRIDRAAVIETDIKCSNGVIHVIDRVIMPSTDSILETAAKAGSFETLAAAVRTAGLVKTLSGKGPYTVFAPTDAAFAKLPAGTVEALLQPRNRDDLVALLEHHVVPGRVYARDALAAETAETLEGTRLRFALDGGMLTVNRATIVSPDVEAGNGVIHVIDEVMLPRPRS